MFKNRIAAAPFDRASFESSLLAASGATRAPVPKQVQYLSQYAEMLGASTVVVEEHYIDRHYVEEYASYYSRMLSPPPNAVQRFHLFSRRFSSTDLNDLFVSSA